MLKEEMNLLAANNIFCQVETDLWDCSLVREFWFDVPLTFLVKCIIRFLGKNQVGVWLQLKIDVHHVPDRSS